MFRLALRQTEGLIGSIIALLGLDLAVPDHTTLSRRAENLAVVGPRPSSGPVHLLVGSTGLKLCGSGEGLLEKHGTKTWRSWRKLHITMDADTGQIAAAALTTSDIDDASQVGASLDQVNGPVASFTADGAYDQDGVYGQVAARYPEASVIVPPRSSAVPSDKSQTAPTMRDRHQQIIAERGRMAWRFQHDNTFRESVWGVHQSGSIPGEIQPGRADEYEHLARARLRRGNVAQFPSGVAHHHCPHRWFPSSFIRDHRGPDRLSVNATSARRAGA